MLNNAAQNTGRQKQILELYCSHHFIQMVIMLQNFNHKLER